MARTEIDIAVPPERVFEVLATPSSFGEWVVGAKEVKDADPEWPAPGSRIQYAIGAGPLDVEDVTTVVEARPPELLELRAQLGPLGSLRIVLTLEARGGGTHVVMEEHAAEGVVEKLENPVTDRLLDRRNERSLDRLRRIAEGGGAPGGAAED